MIKLGNKKEGQTNFQCTIRLLDDNDVLECEFQSFQKGRQLFDYVFNRLNLVETDYFGLRFIDAHKQRHWLDPNKNILRQIKSLSPIIFCFRVKFYPADPLKLHEEITRYYLFLQLRRDLLHGRLYCVQSDAATLGAYIIQADLGDEKPAQDSTYVNDYKILLKQTPKVEEKIAEIHKSLKGVSAATAEIYFLKKASTIDTYGVDPYSVKDHRGIHLYLGLSHAGVLTFQGAKKTNHFHWSEVQKLNYEGKMFIIHLIYMEDARTKRKETVGFKCSSASSCRNLWRAAVEQRLFYTRMDRSNKQGVVVTGGSFFSRGTRFRYQGRCEREVVEDSASIERDPPAVNRVPLKNVGRSTSLPSTPADSDNYESIMSRVHRPLPYIDRSASLDEEVLCGADSPTPAHDLYSNGSYAVTLGTGGAYCPESTLPPISQLEPLVEDNENKFHQASLPDGAFLDSDNPCHDHHYYDRPNQNYSCSTTKSNIKNSFRESSDTAHTHKRLFRHPAVKEDDYIPAQSICDCSDLHHQEDYERDTSSTETLGPPTEPLDVPFAPQQLLRGDSSTSHRNATRSTPSLPLYDSEHERRNEPTIRSSSLAFWNSNVKRFMPNLYRFSQVFFTTFLFVLLTLGLLIILIFESDLAYLEALRSSTELVLLRVHYYEPLRNFVFRDENSNK